MICQICKKEIKSYQALSKHIKNKHDMNSQYYYDLYLKKENEGICSTCRKITSFLRMSKGYQKHCCAKCAQIDPNVDNAFRNHNPQINYHLNKSLMCKNQNVRLIHIYEFEDFNIQKQLLKDLILGQDNYPKDDFNKNNFNNKIPKPKIIYKDGKNTIYGAGKLY